MEKKIIIDFLELLKQRVINNECSADEIEQCKRIAMGAINPKLTREEAIEHFKVSDKSFDSKINKQLPKSKRLRNIVMYPYTELLKLFQ